jgi:alpha-N-arabinofuranosidase
LAEFIATSLPSYPTLDPIPKQYDNHVYQTPGWFAENAFYYDSVKVRGSLHPPHVIMGT